MAERNDQFLWEAGKRLQNRPYVIAEQLGEGGFGLTYRAHHLELELDVVLKTPNRRLRDDPEYARYIALFQKEGRLLAKFSERPHLSIVRVSDLFEEDGYPCLVMDLVPGKDLRVTVNRNGALSPGLAAGYFRQIGEALRRVHDAGLVHRDAHAGNIMLPDQTRAVLIDFGIAASIIPSTPDSMNAFNLQFAPYEQIVGHSRAPSIDIYTVSASLYLAITGELPPNSLAREKYGHELVPPRELDPRIPPELDRVVRKGMELEPEDRPANMREWLEMLPRPQATTQVSPSRFQKLQLHLRSGDWQNADAETTRLLLESADRPESAQIAPADIAGLRWEDLRSIDGLWSKHSGGRFGFAVQKRIWFECLNDWKRYVTRVGWRRDGKSLGYSQCIFSLDAPTGHLPIWGAGRGVRAFWGGGLRGVKTFLYRVHAGGL